ncbi:MAG: hypothetical protein M0R21_10365 [Lentimicrobiaceae bacterium]|nr:hypothetical protein [Lentimicrobiaceae bacterium]
MKISGFSMVKNADKLYYPVKEAILSVLPIVDEFVIAIGDCDPGDHTRALVENIGSEKIKIIDTVWDIARYPRGMENAHQTDIAKSHCTGDWLFYLQADEVIHEKYLPEIRNKCEKYLDDSCVEGLLFKYLHFWGDYQHYHKAHGWYPREIRIIRNLPEIHSFESAQSFRRIPDFDGLNYRRQENTFKLKVAEIDAYVYHYGWVRPPSLMKSKTKALATIHKGREEVERMDKEGKFDFDYGPLNYLAEFNDSHPAVMKEWISRFNWKEQLQYGGKPNPERPRHKHEKCKYRIFGWLKQQLPFLKEWGTFKNYIRAK